jgi:hypothetical protein
MKAILLAASLVIVLATNVAAQTDAQYDPPLIQSELDYLAVASRRVSLDFKELQPKEVLGQIGKKAKLDIEVHGLLPKEPRLTKSFANATVKEILSWYAREVPVIYKAEGSEKLVVLVNTQDVSGDKREAS